MSVLLYIVSLLNEEPLKTILSPGVAILLFVVSNAIQAASATLAGRRATKRLVIGIYTEISYNLRYAQRYVASSKTKDAIKQRLIDDDGIAAGLGRAPVYRPLVAITESTKFYDAITSAIPDIKPSCVAPVSLYYRSVMDQKQAVEAIENYAFLQVGLQSRLETIDELWEAFHESEAFGHDAISALKARYPLPWFVAIKP